MAPFLKLVGVVTGIVIGLLWLSSSQNAIFTKANELDFPFPVRTAYSQKGPVTIHGSAQPPDAISRGFIDTRSDLKEPRWAYSKPLSRHAQMHCQKISSELASGKQPTGQLDIQQLQEAVPGITSARFEAKVVPKDGITEAFLRSFEVVHYKAFNHFGTFTGEYLLPGGKKGRIVALMAARVLPRVDAEMIDMGISAWVRCVHCGHDFEVNAGRHTPTSAATLALVCPSCAKRTEVFGPDRQGHYRWPTWYLRGFAPSLNNNPIDAWQTVLLRCRYKMDNVTYGRDEVWQKAAYTWDTNRGDCEDSAILLVDWLESMGYPCSVVMGTYDGEGHAWVVVQGEKHAYILETTGGRDSFRRIPPRASLATKYNPEFQFNRRGLFMRRSSAWTGNYKGDADWIHQPTCPRAPIHK